MKCLASVIILLIVLYTDIQRRHGVHAARTCSKNCKPLETIHCDEDTGECAEGCNEGYFGSTCNKTCPCGGGPCHFVDGKCVDVSTSEPVQVHPGYKADTQDCNMTVDPLVVCCLCLLIILTPLIIYIGLEKILRKCKRTDQPWNQEDGILMSNLLGPSGASTTCLDPVSQQPSEQFPDTLTKLLVQDLGVHFLYGRNRNPVILFCIQMKFDKRRVNTSRTLLNEDNYLVNKPPNESCEEFPERFRQFEGTSSFSPVFHGDCLSYWEVHSHVHVNIALEPSSVLLCIGLCREADRDVMFQVPFNPYCYNLIVRVCSDHKGICTKIYMNKNSEKKRLADEPTAIGNITGESGDLTYGILVNKGKEYIMFFDLIQKKLLCHLKKVNFDQPLWPMFGVFKRSHSSVRMKLETGRHIDMTPEKKKMILDAVSGVK